MMEERTEHDATLARYLLGNLPGGDQDRIEAQALGDPVLFERLQVIEEDLIDAYVRNELAADDVILFEERFLNHPRGRERVEIARCLQTVMERAVQAKAAPPPRLERSQAAQPLESVESDSMPWLAWAASLLILVLAGWLAWQNLHLGERLNELQSERADWAAERASISAERQQLASDLNAEKQRVEGLNADLLAERQRLAEFEQRLSERPRTARLPLTVAFVLGLGVRSGAGTSPRLMVPSAAARLEIQLGLENVDPTSRFRALIANEAGVEVWGTVALSTNAQSQGLTLELPAAVLPPGRYVLTLQETLDGANEDIGFFEFEIVQGS